VYLANTPDGTVNFGPFEIGVRSLLKVKVGTAPMVDSNVTDLPDAAPTVAVGPGRQL
jgi:hypothetical protein